MSDLQEYEIINRMKESIREAVQACFDLSVYSRVGEPYHTLRTHLLLIEGCCRQMGQFRGDERWLPVGRYMAEAHRLAGGWLRGWKNREGVRIFWRPGDVNVMFVALAKNLKNLYDSVDKLANSATRTNGPVILFEPPRERRVDRVGFEPKPKLILSAR